MSNPLTDSFEMIDAEILAAVQTSNTQKEIETRGAKAAKHIMKLEFKQAAAELGKVADLVGQKGQMRNAADAKFAQARAYAQMGDGLERAIETAFEADRLAEQVDDTIRRGDIALFIANLFVVQEDFVAAHEGASFALDAYDQQGTYPQKHIAALRLRSKVSLLSLQFEEANRDLESALDLAQQSGLKDEIVEITSQQRSAEVYSKGDVSAESLAEIFSLGTLQDEIGAESNLKKAFEKLKQKKYPAALKFAQKSLDQARQTDSVSGTLRYMAASFVLAEAHALADEKMKVLLVMLRCKVYIESKFIPDAGEFIDQYLNSFQQRWGAETLQQTILEYQAWVAEHGPIQT